MLHYATIDTQTLELLRKLQNTPVFSGLRLVGGTSLALQIGHRKSIDEFIVLKSLAYFDDAEKDEEPVMLDPIVWEKLKSSIKNKLQEYLNNQ